MAKWYWSLIQEQGEMPQKTGPFTNIERLRRVAKAFVESGTPEECIYFVVWDDVERVGNVDNLADLTDDELRQL